MKSYRIARLVPIHLAHGYDGVLDGFYRGLREARSLSYNEMLARLYEMEFAHSWGYMKGMRALGHDAYDIVFDFELLQETWAKEHGFISWESWKVDIALKQLEFLKPDIVWLHGMNCFPNSVRKDLKSRFPFIKLVIGFPIDFLEYERLTDIEQLFVDSDTFYKRAKDVGANVHLLYNGFDEDILSKLEPVSFEASERPYDFTFVGSSGFRLRNRFVSRYWDLVELARSTDIELWVLDRDRIRVRRPLVKRIRAGLGNSLATVFRHLNAKQLEKCLSMMSILPGGRAKDKLKRVLDNAMKEKVKASLVETTCESDSRISLSEDTLYDTGLQKRVPEFPLNRLFPDHCYPPVFGLDMYRVLQRSKVTFNKHDDIGEGNVSNTRLFEATGVGACLLTDTGKNMPELFEEDYEVVTYSSIEECIEKAKYLLEHDDVRHQIAEAGQKRTLRDHTVMNRCQQINDILQKIL